MKTWTLRPLMMGVATMAVVLAVSGCAPVTRVKNVQPPAPMDFHHGATLALAAGTVSGSSDGGGLASGSFGWEFTRRVSLAGSGSWFDRGAGADAFAAALTVQANLTRSSPWAPFVEGGPAMYRAAFDPAGPAIPGFYRDRMVNPSAATVAFRDPAFVLGGGFDVLALDHLAIRPVVDVFMVTRDSQWYRWGTFTLRGVYYFNNRRVAP